MKPPAVPSSLRVGSTLLAVSSLGLLTAPITIMAGIPDLAARPHRHTLAGALGLTALAILEFLLAVIPVRRGEGWAMAAATVPFLLVGLPVLTVDATHVAPVRLWNTLLPQVAGLVTGTLALGLCVVGRMRMNR